MGAVMYLGGLRSIWDEKYSDAPDFYTSSLYKVQRDWVSVGAISPSYDYDRYSVSLSGAGRYTLYVSTDPANKPLGEAWANAYGTLSVTLLDRYGSNLFTTSTVGGDAAISFNWYGSSDDLSVKLSGFATTSYALTIKYQEPLNTAPVSSNGTWAVDEDTPGAGILPLALDAEGNAITYSIASQPLHGGVAIKADGSFVYLGLPDYSGPDSFQFKVTDSLGSSSTYTMSVVVRPVNDAPVSYPQSKNVSEDGVLQGTLSVTDADTPQVLLRVITTPLHGTVELGSNGAFTYQPQKDFAGSDSFVFVANDGSLDSNSGVVSITVAPVNDAPVVTSQIPDQLGTAKVPFQFVIPSNTFSDVDSALTLTAVAGNGGALPTWLTFNGATRSFSGTPSPANVGTVSIKVTASDGSLAVSDSFNLEIAPGTNAPPAATAAAFQGKEDGSISSVLPAAVDPEGDPVTYVKASDPSHGVVTITPSGAFTYMPANNYSGSDSFMFRVTDGKASSEVYTVNLSITSVSDTFLGTEQAEDLQGFPGADSYQLKAGRDSVAGGGGDDSLDGGDGIDTARFAGALSEYVIEKSGIGWQVTDSSGAEGVDSLVGIERLTFADAAIALDTHASGNAGQAAQIIRAIFGPAFLAEERYVGLALRLLDDGMSYGDLVALGSTLVPTFAGSGSTESFVRHLYRNVIGQEPSPGELHDFVGLVDGGAMTRESLALLACQSEYNVQSVDLLGLAATGLGFLPS